MAFKPVKKGSLKEQIKKALLNGDVVRRDFRDEEPVELMHREAVRYLPNMGNIGREDKFVYSKVFCDHDIVNEVVSELSKNYSVRKIFCQFCGCCQYSTYGYYIDGE